MTLDNTTIKQLQSLLSSNAWDGVERYRDEYLKENFVENSIKKDSEFETVWNAAFCEGGKYYIQAFLNGLDEAAKE